MNQYYRLPAVHLFASGHFFHQDWSPEFVETLAANLKKLHGLGMPLPSVNLDHDDSKFALGWIDPRTAATIPDPQNPGQKILTADIVNLSAETAERVRCGELRHGSVEFVENFHDDLQREHGPTVIGFALLGAMRPAVKRLGSLPMPVRQDGIVAFSERSLVVRRETVSGRSVGFARPAQAPTPPTRKPQVSTDRDVRLVARWAARNERALKLSGRTAAGTVASFVAARRRGLVRSASEFLGADQVRTIESPVPPAAGPLPPRAEMAEAAQTALPNLSRATLDELSDAALANLVSALADAFGAQAAPADGPADGSPAVMTAMDRAYKKFADEKIAHPRHRADFLASYRAARGRSGPKDLAAVLPKEYRPAC